jgi:hypothetical protein
VVVTLTSSKGADRSSGIAPPLQGGRGFTAAPPPSPPLTNVYTPPPPLPHESRLTLLIVVILVLLVSASFASAFVLYSLQSGFTSSHPSTIPIGSAFAVGSSTRGVCPTGNTFVVDGCAATHVEYSIGISSSSVAFGDLWFRVNAANGSVAYEPAGLGFTILNSSQVVLAQFAVTGGFMSMESSSWAYSQGTSASTSVSVSDNILIDMGTNPPTGQLLTFVVFGAGNYVGTTAPMTLHY